MDWQNAINRNVDHGKSNVSIRLAYILDEIRACCSGASMALAPTIYKIFKQILDNLPDVLDLFHNFQSVVVSLFELLCEVVDKLKSGGTSINDVCIRIIRIYVSHNGSRVSLESTAEEDSLEDLLLLLKLSQTFLNVAFFDSQGKRFTLVLKFI